MNNGFLRKVKNSLKSGPQHRTVGIEFGISVFCEEFYLKKYPDVTTDALAHWLSFGISEGRSPHPLIDTLFYGESVGLQPGLELDHYLSTGWIEGRQISPYLSDLFYRERNPLERYVGKSILEDACMQLASGCELDTGLLDSASLDYQHFDTPLQRVSEFICQWGRSGMVLNHGNITFSPSIQGTSKDLELMEQDPNDWVQDVTLIVPIHNDHPITRQLLERIVVSSKNSSSTDIYVVADGCPDAGFVDWVRSYLSPTQINLIINEQALGFAGAVNQAATASYKMRDLVIVNADILVHPRVFSLLHKTLKSNPGYASISAFSNFGSLASYPVPGIEAHWLPIDSDEFGSIALEVFGSREIIDSPVAFGHLFIARRSVWETVGGLDSVLFPEGYGEEVKWSLDATKLGWKHAIAPGAFAWHVGSTSFGTSRKLQLKQKAERILDSMGTFYREELTKTSTTVSELKHSYRNLEAAIIGSKFDLNRVIITHDRGGGTFEHIDRNVIPEKNDLIIFLNSSRETFNVFLTQGDFPNLSGTHIDLNALAEIINLLSPKSVELHTGTSPNALNLISQMTLVARKIKTRVVLHDFGPFCGRISLMGGIGSMPEYCGGVDSNSYCEKCVGIHGSDIGNVSIASVRAAGKLLFKLAEEVVVPGAEAQRIWSNWGVTTDVIEHHNLRRAPDLYTSLESFKNRATAMDLNPTLMASRAFNSHPDVKRILIPGRISEGKGARLVAQVTSLNRLYGSPFSFYLCGAVDERFKIIDDGFDMKVSNYKGEIPSEIRALGIDLIWIPSIAPETHMYTLDDVFAHFPLTPIFVHESSGAVPRRTAEMWPATQQVILPEPGVILESMYRTLCL